MLHGPVLIIFVSSEARALLTAEATPQQTASCAGIIAGFSSKGTALQLTRAVPRLSGQCEAISGVMGARTAGSCCLQCYDR